MPFCELHQQNHYMNNPCKPNVFSEPITPPPNPIKEIKIIKPVKPIKIHTKPEQPEPNPHGYVYCCPDCGKWFKYSYLKRYHREGKTPDDVCPKHPNYKPE